VHVGAGPSCAGRQKEDVILHVAKNDTNVIITVKQGVDPEAVTKLLQDAIAPTPPRGP
jgi:hypothetical protein